MESSEPLHKAGLLTCQSLSVWVRSPQTSRCLSTKRPHPADAPKTGEAMLITQTLTSMIRTSTGTFPITVTIADSDPATGVGGSFAIVIDSIITATPVATPIVSPGGGLYHEGQALVDVPLGTLTDTDTPRWRAATRCRSTGATARRSRRDRRSDTAADAADPGLVHFFIEGSHTYTEANLHGYTVKFIVTDAIGSKTSANRRIVVADAPLSAALGLPIFATEYQALNNIPVATFDDANSFGSAGDFSAHHDWGDSPTPESTPMLASRLVGAQRPTDTASSTRSMGRTNIRSGQHLPYRDHRSG